jgi:mono/diheme cytochrome c family protein
MPNGLTITGSRNAIPAPTAYASARSTRWDDPAAVAGGEPLFQTHWLVCHGTDGKGKGPGAAGLPQAPADHTLHFYRASGDGDAYLFWRVSEGGQVEPFKSMQSVMPAFKTVLTEDQLWDVLAYVHAKFLRASCRHQSPQRATSSRWSQPAGNSWSSTGPSRVLWSR